MTAAPDTQPAGNIEPARKNFLEGLAVYLQPRVLIVLLLGFSSGLPLALSGSTLILWVADRGMDLKTVGLYSLVGSAYFFKFLWSPLIDVVDVPFLSPLLGRRRGWLLFSQLLLLAAILFLASCGPSSSALTLALGGVLVATASATQDMVVDAFRIESLPERDQAAGAAAYVAGYRVAMLVSTAGIIVFVAFVGRTGVAKGIDWSYGYALMAILVGIGIIATLCASEPSTRARPAPPKAAPLGQNEVPVVAVLVRSAAAMLDTLIEFVTRYGYQAIAVLCFIVLFKLADTLSGTMTGPFALNIGFSKEDYALVVKGVGFAATLLGGFAGGFLARAQPLATCLWIGGISQAAANLAFSWQATIGPQILALGVAVTIENFTSAVGNVIFVAYLSALCRNPLHTATQYALFTALMAFGRIFLPAGAGYVAVATGWAWFFAICAVAGIPGLILLAFLQRRGHFAQLEAAKPSAEAG